MLDALKVCLPLMTVEPTRSSPCVTGGAEVMVILLTLSLLTALAKSSAEKLIALPLIVDFAIALSSARQLRAGERRAPLCFAVEHEVRGSKSASASRVVKRALKQTGLNFFIIPPVKITIVLTTLYLFFRIFMTKKKKAEKFFGKSFFLHTE